ncbi:MAG: STAS domain-containing protein [Clostridiales Family XIII bacterium]|jgi:anti-anti-sigma factor|nr:STAS domain-containing protein [Clostridiales Family XIII bacterium]
MSENTNTAADIDLKGRLDTATSPDWQTKILSALEKKKNLRIDAKELDYISSAGLRVLLLSHKTAIAKGGSCVFLNFSPEVLQILEMTGFTSILSLESVAE